ncbi:hypothetical protein QL285_036265 [Trifolium repens]|nr:hypothetical protein QL285_036264 [Trifolium repens]KAK2413567.1 hypothetical protein QL285_036265 [Trifolium repens]
MTDRGYNNFYTPDEYESYQQCPLDNYGQTPEARLEETMIKFMEMQQQISQMQQMQDQHQQYMKNSLARSKNMEIQLKQMAITQSMEVQTNTQTNPDEKDSILPEEYGESVEEDIEKNEEERIVERGGVVKKVKEMNTPHEVELPQEIPCIEKVNTVDSEKEVMDTNENDGLFDKEESYELKKEIENKAEIDRVIDEIRALFNKKELGRTWTPHNLYFKFMEFLPNQRKKTDDVLSVSFWPP